MTDKIIDNIDVIGCEFCDWKSSNIPQCRIRMASFESICEGYNCYYKQLQREKQNSQESRDTAIKEFNRAEELKTLLKRKEESYEELKQYHNKCCEDNAKELANWLDKFNQASRDFHNGNFCNTEKCQTLAQLKEENDRLRKRIITIFACLIRANRANKIGGTLWVDDITTLWDYIAQTLGLEGDRTQIEVQIEKLYSKGE